LIVGDLGYSVIEEFASKHPDQFVNAGASEQNMIGLAVGMALTGKVVFTYSIGNFGTLRCLEQIRNDVCYHRAEVKVAAVGRGLPSTLLDGSDVTLIASGGMLATSDRVARALTDQGLGVRLISMHTVKPVDRQAITRAATETRYVFTLEEHSVEGGLGGAVAEVMAAIEAPHAPLKRIGLRPEFNTTVGDQTYLKKVHGLDEETVLKTIQQIITRSYGRVG